MMVGCFTLHVYCDAEGHQPPWDNFQEFTGESRAECRRKMRARGNHLVKGTDNRRRVICNVCWREGRR